MELRVDHISSQKRWTWISSLYTLYNIKTRKMWKMHFLSFSLSILLVFCHAFISLTSPLALSPGPIFLNPLLTSVFLTIICLSEFFFLFPLLKIMWWKGPTNQWGVQVSAEKDLIRKLSANTFKTASKNQLLIKFKYYYFFSFWTIVLSIADKCMF